MRPESDWLTRCASSGLRLVERGARNVPAALLCATMVGCTAILGLSDKPLAEVAVDGGDAAVRPHEILFGGVNDGNNSNDDAYYGDTWTFDGAVWTKLAPHMSPSARGGAAAAALAGSMIIFGGMDDNDNDNDDLWSFSDGSWTEVDDGSSASPPPRSYAGMAVLGANVVLFGGFQGTSTNDAGMMVSLNDTWVWNGASWAAQKPTTSPPVRDSMAMATLGGKVFLFGGENSTLESPVALGDTWEWDGTRWTELHPAHTPSARALNGMVPAPADGHTGLILFGGFDQQGDALNDMWVWDGTDWLQLQTGTPDARGEYAIGSFNGGALLFGGEGEDGNDRSDTWLWNGSTWASPSVTGPEARTGAALVGL